MTDFSDGWECSVGNKKIEDVAPKSTVEDVTGDGLTLTKTIPAFRYNTPTLLFRTYQQNVEAYVDGELIYSFGNFQLKAFIQTIPSRWNMVELPADSTGKDVVIKLNSESEKYYGR